MVKIFTCIGRGAVIYIVRPRTATSTSPSSVEDTVERTAVPGRDATGAAAIDPLPTSTVTAIITAYLIAFNFTPQSYKKSANRRLCQSIKSGLSHQKCFLRPQPVFRCILSRCVLTSVASLHPLPIERNRGGATPRLHRPSVYGNPAAAYIYGLYVSKISVPP